MSEEANGTFCWNELMTNDVDKAKEFYRKLIGWETIDEELNYMVFKNKDKNVAGMMAITPEMGNIMPHWMAYIQVPDVDETASKVENLGGKIIVPPTDIPNIGRFSIINDPAGAAVSLFTPAPRQ